MKNFLKLTLIAGLVLLPGSLVLIGCESDSVAPHDQTPELSEENVAYQTAIVAMAVAEIGPQVLDFAPAKNVYIFSFEDYDHISGEVEIDFRAGGADGTPATPDVADYAHLYTVGESSLTLIYGDYTDSAMDLTVDIMTDLDQEAGTATVLTGSGGTMVTGIYSGTYSIDDLVISRSNDYPLSGSISFTTGSHTQVATFDGTVIAVISVDGTPRWTLNLDTGALTEIS